tara:strand:- start:1228 stop:2505 length:1278 start_codon:yes stop_codon:yes gene_type:complete
MKMLSLCVSLIVAAGLLLIACGEPSSQGHNADHAHGHSAQSDKHGAHDEPAKGPNNGRLLQDDNFEIELAFEEGGGTPQFQAWARKNGQPVPPEQVTLQLELERLDGEIDHLEFQPQGSSLRVAGNLREPHSFVVHVRAQHDGRNYEWHYDSFEGRVEIPAERAMEAKIESATAGPQTIHEVLPLYGRVTADPDAVRDVGARFPGAIRSVSRTLGDTVKAGQTLARVESNDSLQIYSVTAPMSGTITARMANPGEQAGTAPLFTITDLSKVWAELSVFPRDLSRIRLGQNVRLSSVDKTRSAMGKIVRIAPSNEGTGQALKVWASIEPSSDSAWTPGLYLQAEVLTGGAEVPVAVSTSALQTFRDFDVVFARFGDIFEVRMLELGRSDGQFVEVRSGLEPGTEYVLRNSYLIKADIEKSGASHDH